VLVVLVVLVVVTALTCMNYAAGATSQRAPTDAVCSL